MTTRDPLKIYTRGEIHSITFHPKGHSEHCLLNNVFVLLLQFNFFLPISMHQPSYKHQLESSFWKHAMFMDILITYLRRQQFCSQCFGNTLATRLHRHRIYAVVMIVSLTWNIALSHWRGKVGRLINVLEEIVLCSLPCCCLLPWPCSRFTISIKLWWLKKLPSPSFLPLCQYLLS